MDETIHFGWAAARLGLIVARIAVIGVGGGVALAWMAAMIQSVQL